MNKVRASSFVTSKFRAVSISTKLARRMARSMATSDTGTDHAVIALGSDESIAADPYDDYDSVSSVSTLTDLLRRYTFAYEPDYCIKLRKRCGPAILGADLTVAPERALSIIAKPAAKGRWLRKVVMDGTDRQLRVHSGKIPILGLLRLQVVAAASPRKGFQLFWKATTQWTRGTAVARKEKYPVSPYLEFRPHWKADFFLPEVTGSIGAAAGGTDLDRGHGHVSIEKMQMVLDLDGGRGLLRSTSAGAGRRRRLLCWKDPSAESQEPTDTEEKDEQRGLTPTDAATEQFDTEWSAVAEPLDLEWPDFEPLAPGELQVHGEPRAELLGLPPCCMPAGAADGAGRAVHDDTVHNRLTAMSLPAADAAADSAGEHSQLPGICGGVQSVFRRLRRGFA